MRAASRVAEAVAGDERVLQVEADLVLVAERDRDAALSVLRVRFGEFELGQTKHTSVSGQLDCGPHAGDAGAYDNEIGFLHESLASLLQANISLQQRTIEQLRAFGEAALK